MIGQLGPGTVIAGYEIQRALGRGGMGDVYLARREGETRTVALKLLNIGLAKETRFRDRFERESHMATSLEHPHIVPVYATGEVEGVRYIAMRYVDGPTLGDLIDDESPLDPRRVLSLLDQVASALDDAHGIGLVHRDVKPGNILISRTGATEFREHAYLTDFGVSKYTGSESGFTRTGQFVGTSLYASPEQIKGEPVGGRTDVYAFGCVLFQCLSGRLPFEKESEAALLWAHMIEEPAPVTSIRPDLPVALDSVVARAMAKAPDERYPTCGSVVKATRDAFVAEPSGAGLGVPAAATVIKPVEEQDDVVPAPETVIGPADDGVPAPTAEEQDDDDAGVAVGTTGSDSVEDGGASPTAVSTVATVEVAAEPAEPDVEVASEAARLGLGATTPVEVEGSPTVEDSVVEAPEPPAGGSRGTAAPATVIVTKADETGHLSDEVIGSRRRHVVLGAGAVGAVLVLGVGAWIAASLGGGGDGASTSETQITEQVASPRVTSRPTVAGISRAGNTLTAERGSWQNSPTKFTYQWRRCNAAGSGCAPVSGATSATYRLNTPDVGRRIGVSITASNAGGSRTSMSRATSVVAPPLRAPSSSTPPTLSGTSQEGSSLVVRTGAWRGTEPISVAREWQRCDTKGGGCVTIEGAGGTTYTLRSADVGHTIRVVERASNAAGRGAVRSKATSVVQTKPPVPPAAQCADGRDNDSDGKVDLADPGCSGVADNREKTTVIPP